MADKNEFVLETKIDLDDTSARSKAEKFKTDYKDIELKAKVLLGDSSNKFDRLKDRISTIKKNFDDAFKIDKKTLSDIEKITADLSKLALTLDNLKNQIKQVKQAEEALNNNNNSQKNQTELVTKYKAVASEIDKLKNKMKSGMDAASFRNASIQLQELENELKQYKSQLNDLSKKKIELYNFKRDKKEITTLISNMEKIESKTKELQSKLSNLNINVNTGQINQIKTELNLLRGKVNSKWSLNFDTGGDLNKLKSLETQLNRLENIEKLEAQLKSFKETMKLAFNGDAEILDLESKINSLVSEISKVDGSFEKAFTSVQTELNETGAKAKELVSEMQKTEKLDQSNLISEYKQLSNTIDNLKKKLNSGLDGNAFVNTDAQIKNLEKQLTDVETKLLDISKKKIEPFNENKSNKELIDFLANMMKIENKADELKGKLDSIKFFSNEYEFGEIQKQLAVIKDEVDKDWDIKFDTNSAFVYLKNLEDSISRLEKADGLRKKFEDIKDSIEKTFGVDKVKEFNNEFSKLVLSTSMDGNIFEKKFESINNDLIETTNKIKQEQSELIAEYKRTYDSISKIQTKLRQNNLNESSQNSLKEELYSLNKKLEDIKKKILDVNGTKIDNIIKDTSKKELDALVSEIVGLDSKTQELRKSLEGIKIKVENEEVIKELKYQLGLLELDLLTLDMHDVGEAYHYLENLQKAIPNLKEVDQLSSKFEKLENVIRSTFGDSVADKLKGDLEALMKESALLDDNFRVTFTNLKAEIEETGNKANRISSDLKKVATVESSFKRVEETIRRAFGDTKVQELETEIENLKASARSMDASFEGALSGFKTDLSEISSQARQVVSNLKKVDTLTGLFNTLREDIEKAFGISAVTELENKLQALEAEARNLGGNFDVMFSEANSQIRRMNSQLNKTASITKTVNNFWVDLTSSLKTFTLGNMLGDSLTSSLYSIKDVFLELDASMTDLKKVADIKDINTVDKLDAIQDKAMEVSKQVGMSTSETISGIASALQAGIGSMEDSIQVARGAMMLANVGDLSQDEASKGLNTIVNSFNIDPLKETSVQVGNVTKKTTELTAAMDKLNYASNTQAIDMQNLIQAFQGGGATLSNYGVEIGDATAMITAANTSLQNGSRVGNGMKSLAINIQGMKANAKEGTLELNKTAKALKVIAGIDVYSDKQKGEIKGVVELLDEIKSKWGSLTEDNQLGLAEAIAGELFAHSTQLPQKG